MTTRFVEVTNGPMNWGKFLVGQFEPSEWARPSVVSPIPSQPLLRQIGYGSPDHQTLVLDLQTGEGALFRLGGYAKADLDKHRVWVCPMFEPFLTWLYDRPQPFVLADLPSFVDLPDAPFAISGYRRSGQ